MKLAPLLLVACAASAPSKPRPPAPEPREPVVDMACVQRAKDGKLADGLPTDLGPFRVTPADHGAHLHRDGRAVVDDAEGKRLWDAFSHDVFTTGMSSADYGMYSIYTCTDVDKRGCIKVDLWLCQTDLDALVARLDDVLTREALGDVALSIDLRFVEGHGPACKDGASCTPQPHYSTHSSYDPLRTRKSEDPGRGSCDDDGDCQPSGQSCVAWWLAGGISTAEYRQYSQPTFCGCVEKRCRFFQQPNLSPRPPFPSRN